MHRARGLEKDLEADRFSLVTSFKFSAKSSWCTHSFGVALSPLCGAWPAWNAGFFLIMQVQLFFIFHRLFSHWHQVIIQLAWSRTDRKKERISKRTFSLTSCRKTAEKCAYLFCEASHNTQVQQLSLQASRRALGAPTTTKINHEHKAFH